MTEKSRMQSSSVLLFLCVQKRRNSSANDFRKLHASLLGESVEVVELLDIQTN